MLLSPLWRRRSPPVSSRLLACRFPFFGVLAAQKCPRGRRRRPKRSACSSVIKKEASHGHNLSKSLFSITKPQTALGNKVPEQETTTKTASAARGFHPSTTLSPLLASHGLEIALYRDKLNTAHLYHGGGGLPAHPRSWRCALSYQ